MNSKFVNEKLKSIGVKDNYFFKYNTDAMEFCFNYSHSNQYQFAIKSTYDGCKAWFPFKEFYDIKTKEYKTDSKNVNWKNRINEKGTKIIQWLYPGESTRKDKDKKPKLDPLQTPSYTFLKSDWTENEETCFKYIGTFFEDYNASTIERHVSRRIMPFVDLSSWYKGIDPNLQYQFYRKDKRDYYKNLYIEADYNKHITAVDSFNKHIGLIKDKEKQLKQKCIYLIQNFTIENACELINKEASSHYTVEYIMNEFGSRENLTSFMQEVYLCANNSEHKHNDLIRNCEYIDKELISKLLMICKPEDYYFYSFSKEKTDYYLDKLKLNNLLRIDEKDDLTERHCVLYFWNECFKEIYNWDAYEYCCFLEETFGSFYEKTNEKTELKPKAESIIKANEEQEEEDERDLYEGNYEFKNSFEYEPKPENKKIIKKEHSKREGVIPRDQQRRLNALARANYKCEINPEHETFISKQGFRYMETHHLIPMQYYDDFDNSIDVEANLVCLCSNCHNEIHYGKDGGLLVLELFEKRKEELKKAGIGNIDEDSLINLYK